MTRAIASLRRRARCAAAAAATATAAAAAAVAARARGGLAQCALGRGGGVEEERFRRVSREDFRRDP